MKGPERRSAKGPSKEEIQKIADKAELRAALTRRKNKEDPIFNDKKFLERHDKSLPLGLKGSPQAKSSPEAHPSGPKMSVDEAEERLMNSLHISRSEVLKRFPMIRYARPGDEFMIVRESSFYILLKLDSDGNQKDGVWIDSKTGMPGSSS